MNGCDETRLVGFRKCQGDILKVSIDLTKVQNLKLSELETQHVRTRVCFTVKVLRSMIVKQYRMVAQCNFRSVICYQDCSLE